MFCPVLTDAASWFSQHVREQKLKRIQLVSDVESYMNSHDAMLDPDPIVNANAIKALKTTLEERILLVGSQIPLNHYLFNSSLWSDPKNVIKFRLKGKTYSFPYPLESGSRLQTCELALHLFKHICEHSIYGNKLLSKAIKENKKGNIMQALDYFDEASELGYERAQEQSVVLYENIQNKYCYLLKSTNSSAEYTNHSATINVNSRNEASSVSSQLFALNYDQNSSTNSSKVPFNSLTWWKWKLVRVLEANFDTSFLSITYNDDIQGSVGLGFSNSLSIDIKPQYITPDDIWIHDAKQLPKWLQELQSYERCYKYFNIMKIKRLIQLVKQDNLLGKRKAAQMLLSMNAGSLVTSPDAVKVGTLVFRDSSPSNILDGINYEGKWLLASTADMGDVEALIELGWLQSDVSIADKIFKLSLVYETNSTIRNIRSTTSGGVASLVSLLYIHVYPVIQDILDIKVENYDNKTIGNLLSHSYDYSCSSFKAIGYNIHQFYNRNLVVYYDAFIVNNKKQIENDDNLYFKKLLSKSKLVRYLLSDENVLIVVLTLLAVILTRIYLRRRRRNDNRHRN